MNNCRLPLPYRWSRIVLFYALLGLILIPCQAVAMPGDVAPAGQPDGRVTVADALVTLRMALGIVPAELRADVAFQDIPDGKVGIADALLVLRSALGLASLDADGESYAPTLKTFSSMVEMVEYLKEGLRVGAEQNNGQEGIDIAYMANDATSSTNLQESGVDEADRMKSDGKFLYIAGGPGQKECCWILPVVEPVNGQAQVLPDRLPADDQVIKIYRLQADPAGSVYETSISMAGKRNTVDGLYLLTEREAGRPDLLVAVGGKRHNAWGNWRAPWSWREGVTELSLFNVEDPLAAAPIAQLTLDGHLVASRRIGEILYLVTRYMPKLPNFEPYPYNDAQRRSNRLALDAVAVEDFLPDMHINGGLTTKLVQPDRCFIPPQRHKPVPEGTLITVTAIDLRQPDKVISHCLAGATETVYVAQDALYLATTRRNDPSVAQGIAPDTTDLHKFLLTSNGPVYHGSGAVVGNLGWDAGKRPFRMSHHNGILRIATSLGRSWDLSATTRLTLLEETAGSDGTAALRETGHVDGIGKPGERLYSVRYQGDSAYLVTFRVTDPLYLFDLSDPGAPKMTGELQIDGYSDYLHPLGDGLLLGIGKDAVADQRSDDFAGRGAWYQGVKLALFDVSQVDNPQELDALVLGRRGTHSALLSNHHAMAWLPASADAPARLALPIELHNTRPVYPGVDTDAPNTRYQWTHTGLYLFDIGPAAKDSGETGIELRGQMIVNSRDSTQTGYVSHPGGEGDRALLAGEGVHYIHQRQVWSSPWGQTDETVGPE